MELFFGVAGALLAALFLTSFVKILTALNILRYGLGLTDGAFGVVLVGVSCGLSMFIMSPKIEAAGGVDAALRSGSPAIERAYRPFIESHTDKKILSRLMAVRAKQQQRAGTVAADTSGAGEVQGGGAQESTAPFSVLAAAFLLSELSSAFAIGVLLLVPFVVIDLAVANLLMSLGAAQISQQIISLPLKLLLFVAVDGWGMVSEKLLNSYL